MANVSKKPSAAQLAARKKFSDIMKTGGFKKKRKIAVKKNPTAKSKLSDSEYVKRKSQITKKAPTKRLVNRRKTHIDTEKPVGYFPNPILKKNIYIVLGIDQRGTYMIKAYNDLNEAKYCAHETAEKELNMTVRVISLKIN